MRRHLNRHMIRGNIGKDPKIKALRNGGIKASFGVATTVSWKDKSTGEWREKTEWHQCEAWEFLAERVAKWFRKGLYVAVEGAVEEHKWNGKDGAQEMRVIRVTDCSLMEKIDAPEPLETTDGQPATPAPDSSGEPDSSAVTEDDDLPF